jgi:hypothetical protein
MSRHTAVLEKSFAHAPAVAQPVPLISGSHAFTGLIARLFNGPEPLRVVAFTSSLPREGVTWTVRRIADELQRTTGLRAAVVTASELRASAPLDVLGAPSIAASARREDRLGELSAASDVVLVDAGSVEASGAVVGLAAKVDSVVVVVQAGRASKHDVSRTVDTIAAAGGRTAGLVLNRRRAHVPAWLEKLLG